MIFGGRLYFHPQLQPHTGFFLSDVPTRLTAEQCCVKKKEGAGRACEALNIEPDPSTDPSTEESQSRLKVVKDRLEKEIYEVEVILRK